MSILWHFWFSRNTLFTHTHTIPDLVITAHYIHETPCFSVFGQVSEKFIRRRTYKFIWIPSTTNVYLGRSYRWKLKPSRLRVFIKQNDRVKKAFLCKKWTNINFSTTIERHLYSQFSNTRTLISWGVAVKQSMDQKTQASRVCYVIAAISACFSINNSWSTRKQSRGLSTIFASPSMMESSSFISSPKRTSFR